MKCLSFFLSFLLSFPFLFFFVLSQSDSIKKQNGNKIKKENESAEYGTPLFSFSLSLFSTHFYFLEIETPNEFDLKKTKGIHKTPNPFHLSKKKTIKATNENSQDLSSADYLGFDSGWYGMEYHCKFLISEIFLKISFCLQEL